jgi:cardiolipin synthase
MNRAQPHAGGSFGVHFERDALPSLRQLADQAFSRAAGAPLVHGNRIRLLKDATENYPAWFDAIHSARHAIHFESYIIHADDVGRQFADALIAKAREGVRVRLTYDWFGAIGAASFRFWRPLRQAGVEVRRFNPPRFDSPLGWISRDHRKMLSVDGRLAFVTGLCMGRQWVGNPEKGIAPWRDTGVQIEGPAVVDVERAFGEVWAQLGSPLPEDEIPAEGSIPPAGDTSLRIVGTTPYTAGLFRLDQLIAAVARRSIWLTDAYFVGVSPYVQALRAAAADGVDVRLLVPGGGDVVLLPSLSRAGFRGLLEAGVRIFEWNGPMLHAKTAVADGRWARVGSTNLNLTSWLGNWELDVVVEDERFAQQMEEMYLDDLANSTEITLGRRQMLLAHRALRKKRQGMRTAGGSTGRAARGVLRLGNAVGAAITGQRSLGPAEARVLLLASLLILLFSVAVLTFPRELAIPTALFSLWIGLSLIVKAWRLHRESRRKT